MLWLELMSVPQNDETITVEDVQREYWRIVETGNNDKPLTVEYGSDLDVSELGSGVCASLGWVNAYRRLSGHRRVRPLWLEREQHREAASLGLKALKQHQWHHNSLALRWHAVL